MIKKLTIPVEDESKLMELEAGDMVRLTGTLYTARDQAHKRIVETLDKGESPPFDLKNSMVYYCGPTPEREDGLFGSAGPTTASRMDKMTPRLLEQGMKGTIGKGERSPEVLEACRKYGAVYLAAFGGTGAYYAGRIKKQELVAYPELGAEAVYKLEVEDFPVIVAVDAKGKTIL
ncbi:MAG: fumarate hydratase [Spirochaetes bacterium GWF1_51_8]|nr:MAG: fumarate hydratase [Spirochaetes bacterium GWF1_51_8]